MKNTKIDLHLCRTRAIVLVFFTTVLLLALNLVALFTIENNIAQLNCLLNSNYLYSATMIPASKADDYICFEAGISFKLSEEATSSINADVVMQSAGTQYTESLYWNANELSAYGIAISSSIAREYGINVDDSLFSKHIVNDEVIEYRVEQIIPDVMCIRVKDNGISSNGVIIMGYDQNYIDNISHVHLVYTREPVNALFEYSQGTLTDIVYKKDEITALFRVLIPYIIVLETCSVMFFVGLVFFLKKELSYNFKRLMIAGFERKRLNLAYNRCAIGLSILSIILASAMTLVILLFYSASSLMYIYYLATLLIEAVAIVIAAQTVKRSLWRK